ncbi:MAG TPA: Trm112 family protein [bacterium]|nr:Trm112 family protein [bacterium]HPQ66203.1 Trm112 family protein [bacterium]
MLDEKLLAILVCPACKSPLRYDSGQERLYCLDRDRETREFRRGERCGLIYPVRDGIPVMLIDEAEAPVD